MHREIKYQAVLVVTWCFLICARNILAADNKPNASVDAGVAPAMSNAQAIRQALGEQAAFEFQGVPLNDVAGEIAEKHHVQPMFDNTAMKESGIDPATTLVTLSVKDVSLRSALKMILTPLRLTSTVKDEVLLITTKAKAASMYETRLYDVRDLIVHENDPGESPDFSALIDAIQSTVNPSGWDKAGGQGSVAPFNNNGICALMIWQNALGHDRGALRDILAYHLRSTGGSQAAARVDSRLLDMLPNNPELMNLLTPFFTEEQVALLMKGATDGSQSQT